MSRCCFVWTPFVAMQTSALWAVAAAFLMNRVIHVEISIRHIFDSIIINYLCVYGSVSSLIERNDDERYHMNRLQCTTRLCFGVFFFYIDICNLFMTLLPLNFKKMLIFCCCCFFVAAEYIIQCHRSDPKLLDCLKGSLHHLRPYLAQGIPEIEVCRSI